VPQTFVLGVCGIDEVNGVTTHVPADARVKRAAVASCGRTIAVADRSKLGEVAFAHVCSLSAGLALAGEWPCAYRGAPQREFERHSRSGASAGPAASLHNRLLRRQARTVVHQILLAFLAAASGIMAVLMLGLHGGPHITASVTLYQFLGYCLLVIAAILALRVLVTVLRPYKT
jgi:hypothetical protein